MLFVFYLFLFPFPCSYIHDILINCRYSRKPECKDVIEELEQSMARRKVDLSEIEQALPKKNGTYLKIILGNVNVSILNKDEKYGCIIIFMIWPRFNNYMSC